MKLQKLLDTPDNERAVSPVIGVILMVAITVILAAVIGTFVLGLGDSVESAPQATLQVQENGVTSSFDLRHRGGDPIDYNEIDIVLESDPGTPDGTYTYGSSGNNGEYASDDDATITAGENNEITLGGTGTGTEDVTVTLVHTPSENIILEQTVEIKLG